MFVHLHRLHKIGSILPLVTYLVSFSLLSMSVSSACSKSFTLTCLNYVSRYAYLLCQSNSQKAGKDEDLHGYLVLWKHIQKITNVFYLLKVPYSGVHICLIIFREIMEKRQWRLVKGEALKNVLNMDPSVYFETVTFIVVVQQDVI